MRRVVANKRFGTSLISAIVGHVLLLVGMRALAGAQPTAGPRPEPLTIHLVPARPDPVLDAALAAPRPPSEKPPVARPAARPRALPRPAKTASPRGAPAPESPPSPPATVDAAEPSPAPLPAPSPLPAEPVVSRGEPVVAKPHYRSNPKPDYPTQSLRQREEGVVLLDVEVEVDGRSGEIALKRSSGHPLLDKAAIQAVRRWTFEPARVDGRAMSSWVVVPVRFSLMNP
jgi:periplasmic protein TonB